MHRGRDKPLCWLQACDRRGEKTILSKWLPNNPDWMYGDYNERRGNKRDDGSAGSTVKQMKAYLPIGDSNPCGENVAVATLRGLERPWKDGYCSGAWQVRSTDKDSPQLCTFDFLQFSYIRHEQGIQPTTQRKCMCKVLRLQVYMHMSSED